MAKGIYATIGSVTKKIKKPYAVIDGVTKKIKKAYVIVDGKTRLMFSGSTPAGSKTFTSSTTWTVPDGISSVDIFCVGGGGGGGRGYYEFNDIGTGDDGTYYYDAQSAGGVSGAGGYTTTKTSVAVSSGESLTITIGAGGTAGQSPATSYTQGSSGTYGGSTTVMKSNGSVLASASGGDGGSGNSKQGYRNGANGGSGSNGRYYSVWGTTEYNGSFTISPSSHQTSYNRTNKLTDQINGADGRYYSSIYSSGVAQAGVGQHSTTRAWGIDDESSTLYSSAARHASEMVANSGHGGAGGDRNAAVDGASGFVIIKWAAQS